MGCNAIHWEYLDKFVVSVINHLRGMKWSSKAGEQALVCQSQVGDFMSFCKKYVSHIWKTPRPWLVGGLEHFSFFHILGIMIPTDFHIFQQGWNHQPDGLVEVFAHIGERGTRYQGCWMFDGIPIGSNSWFLIKPWNPKSCKLDQTWWFLKEQVPRHGLGSLNLKNVEGSESHPMTGRDSNLIACQGSKLRQFFVDVASAKLT